MENELSSLASSGDVLFMMLGAVMVFTMHGGFAFLEVGSVRKNRFFRENHANSRTYPRKSSSPQARKNVNVF